MLELPTMWRPLRESQGKAWGLDGCVGWVLCVWGRGTSRHVQHSREGSWKVTQVKQEPAEACLLNSSRGDRRF